MVLVPWLLTTSMLSLVAASESILDIIDTREVQRLLEARRTNSSVSSTGDSSLEHNHLDAENLNQEQLRQNWTSQMVGPGELLRSSEEALLVTRAEYLRRDWCRTEPLVQVVREHGCTPVSVLNSFCYGQCNSFFIPNNPSRKGKVTKSDFELAAFKSCAFCRPKLWSWVTVTLRCRRRRKPALRRKRVLQVKQCKCVAVSEAGTVN